MFTLTENKIEEKNLLSDRSGAFVSFHGRVRNHNEGEKVQSLEYQVYSELALKEGNKILQEAKEKFLLHEVMAIHRYGHLKIGDTAIWIGCTSSHRDESYKASRYIIDEIKKRLPIWKKEHYENGKREWVFCHDHIHHVHFDEASYYERQKRLVSQEKLKGASVLVVGAGGLGSPLLMSLAQAGIGFITVVDFDKVHLSNLHRQLLYSTEDVGEFKAAVASRKIKAINPFIHIDVIQERVKDDHLKNHDLIFDCSDNMETKYYLYELSQRKSIPLISGSIFQYEGLVRTFVTGSKIYTKEMPDDALLGNCNERGVIGASVNALGSLMAVEGITYLQEHSNRSIDHSLFFDFKNMNLMKVKHPIIQELPCSL